MNSNMKIKVESEKPTAFELLFVELIEANCGDVSMNQGHDEINLFLGTDSCRTILLSKDGKWRIE